MNYDEMMNPIACMSRRPNGMIAASDAVRLIADPRLRTGSRQPDLLAGVQSRPVLLFRRRMYCKIGKLPTEMPYEIIDKPLGVFKALTIFEQKCHSIFKRG